MSYEIVGDLVSRSETIQVTDTFQKRTFVILVKNERDSRYDDMIEFQLVQDRCGLIDNFKKNQIVRVKFNISGRSYKSKTTGKVGFFNTLNAWSVEDDYASQDHTYSNEPQPQQQTSNGGVSGSTQPRPQVAPQPKSEPRVVIDDLPDDDNLPF